LIAKTNLENRSGDSCLEGGKIEGHKMLDFVLKLAIILD